MSNETMTDALQRMATMFRSEAASAAASDQASNAFRQCAEEVDELAARLRGEAAPEGQAVAQWQVRVIGHAWQNATDEYFADRMVEIYQADGSSAEKRALYDRPQPVAVAGDASALEWLRGVILREPVRREKIGGQTHSYLDADDVLGWIKEAQKRTALSAAPAALDEPFGNSEQLPAPVAGDAVSKLPAKWREEARAHEGVTHYDYGLVAGKISSADELEAALAQDRASQAGTAGVPAGCPTMQPGYPGDAAIAKAFRVESTTAPLDTQVSFIHRVIDRARLLAAAPTPAAEGEVRDA